MALLRRAACPAYEGIETVLPNHMPKRRLS